MARRYWRVLVRASGSDNFLAVGASDDGAFTVSYHTAGGLRFADRESAELFLHVVKRYGIAGENVAAYEVRSVGEVSA